MKNLLFKRISRIISANVNSLLDSIEGVNSESVMKEAIKEVESAVDEVRDELAKVLSTKHLASKQLVQKNNQYEELSEKIELAIREKREDLAEVAVAEQLDIEDQLPILEKTLHDAQEEEKELDGYINALKSKIKEMKNDLNNLNIAKSEESSPLAKNSSTERKIENAENSFDEAIKYSSISKGLKGKDDLKQRAKLEELEELQRKNRIKERLEQYKG